MKESQFAILEAGEKRQKILEIVICYLFNEIVKFGKKLIRKKFEIWFINFVHYRSPIRYLYHSTVGNPDGVLDFNFLGNMSLQFY
jgi:hypothetical protein